jgi:hypothetical protein
LESEGPSSRSTDAELSPLSAAESRSQSSVSGNESEGERAVEDLTSLEWSQNFPCGSTKAATERANCRECYSPTVRREREIKKVDLHRSWLCGGGFCLRGVRKRGGSADRLQVAVVESIGGELHIGLQCCGMLC